MVSGSYQMIDYISASQYINEDMVLMPMREACSLGDTTVISGKDLSSATVTFSSLIANLLGVGVFTLGIPVVLIVIALVVFFKRRHL